MSESQVYYMDAHSESIETSLAAKMITVFDAAGLDEIVKPNDIVAIKIHCGEWNNSAYLRPVYARTLADRVKELGGRPFVCDTTTSTYSPWGSRSSELDIILTAERNGYSSATLGCPFICADGFIGTSDFRVDIPEGYWWGFKKPGHWGSIEERKTECSHGRSSHVWVGGCWGISSRKL